jgi:predicted transcriptional regulator
VFDYSAEQFLQNNNNGVIADKLLQLNGIQPELNIIHIFEMKYKQNKTVTEIAENLNMDKDVVITALNKIVELV